VTFVPRYPTQDPNYRILAHQTSRLLNGHSFMERELKRNNIGFHKNDNAFLAGLLDAHRWTQVLKQGTQPDKLFDYTDRVLPELHFQTPLPHPQHL